MTDREYIFMPHDQIVESICTDFRQYAPQVLLFCEIIRLISDGETIVKRTPDQPGGIWIRKVGSRNMRRLEGSDLVEYMCALLKTVDLSPQMLSDVASRVFQTKVIRSKDPDTGRNGFLLKTGMEGFRCRQCGHCCQSLDYRYEIMEDDVARWQTLGRNDILEWVGVFKGQDQETVYQIWVTPGTRQVADTCPFLVKDRATTRWFCRIHDAKPAICRQYPVGRKHAILTGCPGFDDK
jgi:Fe-S-cluster containining protein